jgi:hypothetical protein
MGERKAIITIRHTVGKGWQGLREPDPSPVNRPAFAKVQTDARDRYPSVDKAVPRDDRPPTPEEIEAAQKARAELRRMLGREEAAA